MYVEFLVKIFKVLTNNALMIFLIVLMYIQTENINIRSYINFYK